MEFQEVILTYRNCNTRILLFQLAQYLNLDYNAVANTFVWECNGDLHVMAQLTGQQFYAKYRHFYSPNRCPSPLDDFSKMDLVNTHTLPSYFFRLWEPIQPYDIVEFCQEYDLPEKDFTAFVKRRLGFPVTGMVWGNHVETLCAEFRARRWASRFYPNIWECPSASIWVQRIIWLEYKRIYWVRRIRNYKRRICDFFSDIWHLFSPILLFLTVLILAILDCPKLWVMFVKLRSQADLAEMALHFRQYQTLRTIPIAQLQERSRSFAKADCSIYDYLHGEVGLSADTGSTHHEVLRHWQEHQAQANTSRLLRIKMITKTVWKNAGCLYRSSFS